MKIVLYLIVFMFITCTGHAQPWLTGKIFKKASIEVVAGVTVYNLHRNSYNMSDAGGNYKIVAVRGDTVVFSSAGYRPDTIAITNTMIVNEYDVYLAPNIVVLESVEVDPLDRYLADSIRRREEYAFLLDKKHPVKLMNEKRAGDAPGLNFSPIGYFSKEAKQKRQLKLRLEAEEDRDRQAFIDARFSVTRIGAMTKLSGDSLHLFMRMYRPGFNFCRYTSSQEMLLYINDMLIIFRRTPGKKG